MEIAVVISPVPGRTLKAAFVVCGSERYPLTHIQDERWTGDIPASEVKRNIELDYEFADA